MTTFPLSTLGPTISSAGISAPGYADIYQSLVASYQSIYGSDIVLTADTQDGQWIGIIAKAISDCNTAAVTIFNSYSPLTAQGTHLSSMVKINGITRQASSFSTADIVVTGTAGTIITNGKVSDGSYYWSLPASVTIPSTASITVTATCDTTGAITASANTITTIATPTRGWLTATNPSAANPGVAVETDAQLRARQILSTTIPSLSVLETIQASILNVSGVSRCVAHENDTNATDSIGVPSHTIWLVVEGGDAATIANTIATNKTPGTGTYGDVVQTVQDQYGVPSIIRYSNPTYKRIVVNLSVKALAGYTVQIGNNIIAGISDYINSLAIGESIYLTQVISAAIQASGAPSTFNLTALTQGIFGGSITAADIVMDFDWSATSDIADITLSLV
jgi:uncharacterized phage protein gp47/JayE